MIHNNSFYSLEISIQDILNSISEGVLNSQIIEKFTNFMKNSINAIAEAIFENNPIFWTIIIFIFTVFIIFIAISNYVKRYRLEKDLSNEYNKIDKRVDEASRKLRLSNKNLMDEMNSFKEIEKNLTQIKQAMDTMKLGVTITDSFGKILYVNNANADMHNYKQKELIGQYSSIFTSNVLREPVDLDDQSEWLGKVITSSNITKNGEIFPVQLISNLVKNEKGELVAIVTTYEDITERTIAEQALKRSEENFRSIFNNIQDVYYEVSIDGMIKEISPSVNSVLKYNRNDLIGKPMNDLYANTSQRENFLKALKKDEKVYDYEIMLKANKTDKNIPCSVTAKLILDENGLPLKIIGSLRNITKRKKIEEEQNRTLKELQSVNKELQDFTYVTSHDLKSPLRAINTLANWISLDYAEKFDENGREQMNLLLGRVDRMNQLIEAIFQYSSLGSYQGKLENINLNSVVNKIIEKMNISQEISVAIEKELPDIQYEKERIEQIFQHLLKNAVQFMNKPEGKINIGYESVEDYWQFHITDNGPGIEKRHFDRIFEMFKTLQSRDDLESSGIGLTIVKKIVEMNTGKVWVESQFGKGSTFFFTIPKKREIPKQK